MTDNNNNWSVSLRSLIPAEKQVLVLCCFPDNDTLALRGNSVATKAVESYMKLVGQKVKTFNVSEENIAVICRILLVVFAVLGVIYSASCGVCLVWAWSIPG